MLVANKLMNSRCLLSECIGCVGRNEQWRCIIHTSIQKERQNQQRIVTEAYLTNKVHERTNNSEKVHDCGVLRITYASHIESISFSLNRSTPSSSCQWYPMCAPWHYQSPRKRPQSLRIQSWQLAVLALLVELLPLYIHSQQHSKHLQFIVNFKTLMSMYMDFVEWKGTG